MSDREVLFGQQPPRRRSYLSGVVSLAVHLAAAGAWTVASLFLTADAEPQRVAGSRLTFVNVVTPTDLFVKERPSLKTLEPKPKDVTPEPPPTLSRAEIQPPARPTMTPLEAPARPRPAKPVAEAAVVGAFERPSAGQARALAPRRVVESTSFDAASSRSTLEPRDGNAVIGAFQSASADGRLGSNRIGSHVIADAGFSLAGRSKDAPASRTVSDAGFGNLETGDRRPPSRDARDVQRSGFGDLDAVPPPAVRPTPKPQRVEASVEIIVKPTPEYSDEARAQKIEGEVLLEVEFRASGEVRVLRVVRGLGHGLDESASRAAERILFRPARSSAGPVDFRAMVQIVFRLS
jgi:TonB family protein